MREVLEKKERIIIFKKREYTQEVKAGVEKMQLWIV